MLNLFYSNQRGPLKQLLCIPFLVAILFSHQISAADLNNLQRQIKQSKQTKSEQQKQQQQLEDQLSASDQAIAKASLQVNQTKKMINDKRNALITLQQETKQLEDDKKKQQTLLEQQLISAYMTGQNDLIKLMLNQEDLSKVIRAKSYYYYLNEARLESIEALHSTQQKLDKNASQQAAALTSLESLYQEQKQTQATVNNQRSKRDQALRELKQDINYQNEKIAELANSEKVLRARIKKAAEDRKKRQLAAAKAKAAQERKNRAKAQAQAAQEREKIAQAEAAARNKAKNNSKLAGLKGKLPWPIQGKVLHRFGSARSSQVTWKGIAIAANEGEKVRAVATGRVLFAGYFKGYGMVIALDHSDNYITLYGYNETLLQKAGDVVFQGDAIALAGHSGGQDRNSLYFELSHKGKAEDPLRWLTRSK